MVTMPNAGGITVVDQIGLQCKGIEGGLTWHAAPNNTDATTPLFTATETSLDETVASFSATHCPANMVLAGINGLWHSPTGVNQDRFGISDLEIVCEPLIQGVSPQIVSSQRRTIPVPGSVGSGTPIESEATTCP